MLSNGWTIGRKIKIISSGGTYKEIKRLKFNCLEVSDFTNSPEILEGRVKTLHPKIHAGILHDRQNKRHKSEMFKQNFPAIFMDCLSQPFFDRPSAFPSHK